MELAIRLSRTASFEILGRIAFELGFLTQQFYPGPFAAGHP